MRTIAAETGLAVATVSRALNDAPDIGQGTKERVREAARRLGYRPNRAARRLRTGRTQVISLLLGQDPHVMTHTAQLIHSLAGGLRATNYHLVVTPVLDGEDPMEMVRYIAETGSADAVVLNKTQPDDPRVAYLMARGIPVATHGRTGSDAHPWFDFDNGAFGALAVRTLAARGRRRVLLIPPHGAQSYARHMVEGARAGAQSAGVALDILDGASSDDPADLVVGRLRARLGPGGVDAIVCGSPSVALASTEAAEEAGLTVGEGIDLVSKEAVPFLKRFRPAIVTIREDVEEAGLFLARAALAAIADPSAPPMHRLVAPVPDDVG
ncbi:MAG: LacI family DNA-binding transcriptional regulator [Hasllibacter sp.]